MNPDRDFDRLLDQWFADGPGEVSDRVVGEVADRIERQSQRPAWRLYWKDFHMTTPVRAAASLAAVLVLAVGAYAVIQRPGLGSGGTGSTPSPTPLPTPEATYTVIAGPSGMNSLHAANFDVPLSLTFGADWNVAAVDKGQVDLLRGDTDLGIHSMALVTLPGATLTDPWIPVPADFVGWINQRPEFVPSAPRTVTFAGRSGTLIDADIVWKDGAANHDFLRYGTGGWAYNQYNNVGHRARFIILPGPSGVGGLVIVMNAPGADFDAAATSLDAILATLQIDPAP